MCWNAPFKANFRQHYENWMLHGEKELTDGGNMRSPPLNEWLNWLVLAWESLPQETIVNSFKVCGITNAIDGSEDEQIHCFKANGPIPTGHESLRRAHNERLINDLGDIFGDIDFFQDEENGILSDGSLEL